MKLNKLILVAFTAVSLNVNAGGYIGGQYTNIDYEVPIATMKPKALSVIGGKSFNDIFSIEARIGPGVDDDTIVIDGEKIHFGFKGLYGAYGKFTFLQDAAFSPYAVIGFTYAKVQAEVKSRSFKDGRSDTELSYGMGLNYNIDRENALRLEYLRYFTDFNNSDIEISGLTLGYEKRI